MTICEIIDQLIDIIVAREQCSPSVAHDLFTDAFKSPLIKDLILYTVASRDTVKLPG